MRLALLVGKGFTYWTREFVEAIREHCEVEDVAVFTQDRQKARFIEQQGFASRVIDLEDYPDRFDDENDFTAELAEWDRRLGAGTLNRLMVADRRLSLEYLVGLRRVRTLLDVHPDSKKIKQQMLAYTVRKCSDFFEEFRPTVFFAFGTAAFAPILLYELAGYHGVSFRTIVCNRIGDLYSIGDNPYFLNRRAIALYRSEEELPADVMTRAEESYAHLSQLGLDDSRVSYQTSYRIKARERLNASWFWIFRRLLSRAWTHYRDYFKRRNGWFTTLPWDDTVFFFHHLAGGRLTMSREHFETPAPGEKFVYFPLHVMPEASTTVLTPNHTDQMLLLELITKAVPIDWKIYVKEHVPMLGKRKSGFYDRVREFRNVRLVDPLLNSARLIRDCRIVITSSGTAAQEAVFVGRPALTLAPSNYEMAGLSVHRPDLEKLSEAIQRAISICEEVTPEERRRRLLRVAGCIHATTFEFDADAIWRFKKGKDLPKHLPGIRRLAKHLVASLTAQGAEPKADRVASASN